MKENIELIPLKEDIVIKIVDLRYGKNANIVVTALYESIDFRFSVFFDNGYCSMDKNLSFKILDEKQELKIPDYKILANFNITRSGHLRCINAKVYD